MSKIKVDTVTNVAGSGAPNIPDGITIGGVALASVNTQEHYAQSTEPSSPKNGAVWYDTDDDKAYVYINSEFYELAYTNIPTFLGSRALVAGGNTTSSSAVNVIQYFAIPTTANAVDFGDLTQTRSYLSGCSNGERGLFGGGQAGSYGSTVYNTIDYVTIGTTGNAIDFGDLVATRSYLASCSGGNRAVFAGGGNSSSSTAANAIQWVSFLTTGNAISFGILGQSRFGLAGCSNGSRGVFAGGKFPYQSTSYNIIDYITIDTMGNSTDFGDLTVGRNRLAGCSNETRGVFAGGTTNGIWDYKNEIDYITIATTGNATDFGDLSEQKFDMAGAANSTRATFSGGTKGDTHKNAIEYITIANTGNATDFGDLLAVTEAPAGLSGD